MNLVNAAYNITRAISLLEKAIASLGDGHTEEDLLLQTAHTLRNSAQRLLKEQEMLLSGVRQKLGAVLGGEGR